MSFFTVDRSCCFPAELSTLLNFHDSVVSYRFSLASMRKLLAENPYMEFLNEVQVLFALFLTSFYLKHLLNLNLIIVLMQIFIISQG